MKITRRQLRRIILESVNMINEKKVTPYGFSVDGDEVTAGEVEFDYGRYTGSLKDTRYWISQEADGLGSIQKRGDPYTYEKVGSDRLKIVSGPAKSYEDAEKWAGKIIKDPNATGSNQTDNTETAEASPTSRAAMSSSGTTTAAKGRYAATPEQVAKLAMLLSNEPSLERGSRAVYITFAKQLESSPDKKDSILKTILTAPGVDRERVRQLAQDANIPLKQPK